jgi:hypothetical protein
MTFALPDLTAVTPNGLVFSMCNQGIFPARDHDPRGGGQFSEASFELRPNINSLIVASQNAV